MDRYEIVRRVTSKGAFGEIFVVKHRHEGLGSNQYVLKRARLTKMSEAERARLAAEVHIHHQLQRGLPEQHGSVSAHCTALLWHSRQPSLIFALVTKLRTAVLLGLFVIATHTRMAAL
eukprot:SAG31_NODE_1446_length_8318_cov_8.573914_12_plen_118_part_00